MDSAPKHTTIDLLRHGQLVTPGVFCADANTKVSQSGMQNLLTATEEGNWDLIISSPQTRCLEFAKKLSEQSQTTLVIDDHFKEMNFGDWVGIKNDVLWQQHSEQYQQLWQNPDDFIAPNGESMKAFYSRVQTGFKDMLAQYKGQSILLVTHAGVIRTILAHSLDIGTLSVLKFDITYAHISRLHCYTDGHFSLAFLNNKRLTKMPENKMVENKTTEKSG